MYFNGHRIPNREECCSAIVQPILSTGNAGIININQCGVFSTTAEGVYTCTMMNSAKLNELVRFGMYFTGRGESLNSHTTSHRLTMHLSFLHTVAPVVYTPSSSTVTVTIGSHYPVFQRVLPQTHSHGGRIMTQQYYSPLVSLQWIILVLVQCSVLTTPLLVLLQVIVEHTHVM